jgi:hypothetical protein
MGRKFANGSRRDAGPQGRTGWRLAMRGPILVYDEYSDEEIELSLGQRDPDSIEGLVIDFRYAAANGEMSRRSVLCWQCGRNGDRLYVRGYCPFREELRTFRIDRMSDVIAMQGEQEMQVADAILFFAAFAARAAARHAPLHLEAPD